MKIKLLFFFIVFSNLVSAQGPNDKKVYLDSLGNETLNEAHTYYRIISDYNLEKEEYHIEDYYISGKLRKIGNSTKKEFLKENGEFVSYYENGNKKSTINYDNGLENGNCDFWHENGNKKLEGKYIILGDVKDKKVLFKIINYWDANKTQKTTDGNGEFDDDGSYEKQNAYSLSSGKVDNGFKDGIWKGQHFGPDFTFTEVYENAKFISGVSIDTDGNEYKYNEILIKAVPAKGIKDLYEHVKNNFNPPNSFRGRGKVITEFIIDNEGKIVDAKIIISVSKDVDNEAIRTISSFKGFMPLKLRGVKMKCTYKMPIAIETPD